MISKIGWIILQILRILKSCKKMRNAVIVALEVVLNA